MSSWRSGRGLQWQPVKLWWTPCPRGLRQCWKIMVATQNIDTLGPIWTFPLRGVFTFVANGLDINGCVLSYFEGTANLHCYTGCTLTTLHWSRVSFLQCCHMKRYNKIFTMPWGVYLLLWDTVCPCVHTALKHQACVAWGAVRILIHPKNVEWVWVQGCVQVTHFIPHQTCNKHLHWAGTCFCKQYHEAPRK